VWLLAGTGNRGTLAFGWATVVLGAGLVAGTFAGRARWLIVPALATSVAAVGAAALSFAGVGLSDHAGDRTLYIGEGTAIAERYETGMGDFELVLADYPGDLTTTVEVGVGDLRVVVPDNAQVQINARVGLGSIDALGSSRNGYRRSLILDDQPDATHLIKLVLRVGVGTIDVRRASFAKVPFITVPTFLPLPDRPFPEVPVADVPARQIFGDGTVLYQDGSIGFANGERIEANGSYTIAIVEQRADGSVQLENGAVIDADGSVVTPGGFVIPREIFNDAPPPSTTTLVLSSTSTSLATTPTTVPTEVPQP
jgi:hypothetical protein